MSIEGIVIGLIGVVLGAVFCVAGFRWFMLLLPIWGLFVGFMVGAGATATLLGEGFLASALGIVVGIVVALLFALLSWFYWWGAVLVVAGSLGYVVAHWLLVAIGFNGDGWLTVGISIVAGLAVGVVAFLINAPKYVAILLTAFAGAAWLAAGIALFLGLIKPEDLPNGALAAVYTQGWLWILIWALAGAAGVVAQLQMTARMEQDLVAAYGGRKPF
jgi:Domain of unknown function (DUF4203)